MDDKYYWTGDDWESFCQGLLQDRHGSVEIQKVPSKHQGDDGLDYYCKSEGIAFQCYAVEEPVGPAIRAKKQKDKITTDIKKFIDNGEDVKNLFGGTAVKRWVLLVPIHDSNDVNKHATKKAREVIEKGLAYIDQSFDIVIQDLTAFDSDLLSARIASLHQITLPISIPSATDVSAFMASESELIDNIRGKLAKKALAGGPNLIEAEERFVSKLIERDNALERLRSVSPDAYEKINLAIARRTERLELIGVSPGITPPEILQQELEQLIAEIADALPALSKDNATSIAYGTLSDWLMRCPLDFPPYGH